MEIKSVLEQFGLQGKKADIYLASLELGSATVIEIAKKSGVKRTTCYDILMELEKDGLISETAKGKKRLFSGEDPEKIQRKLKERDNLFSEILPQLKSIYNIKGIKPKIQFYEGKEGLRKVYEDTLQYSNEILAFATEDSVKVLGMDWATNYIGARIRKGIQQRAIVPRTDFIIECFSSKDQSQNRMSKLIDPRKYPFSVEINIYGFQKVAFMSAREETGVIIEGAEIYKTMKLIFELLWDNLPEVERK